MSVLEAWNMRCPSCGRDSAIDITARIDVRLTSDGTDADLSENHDHEWDDASPAFCRDCGFTGTVKNFTEGVHGREPQAERGAP